MNKTQAKAFAAEKLGPVFDVLTAAGFTDVKAEVADHADGPLISVTGTHDGRARELSLLVDGVSEQFALSFFMSGARTSARHAA